MSNSAPSSPSPLETWSGRAIWLALILLVLVSGVSLTRAVFPVATDTAPYSCVESTYNFEVAFVGDTVEHEFEVINISDSDLLIEKAVSGCGCIIVSESLPGTKIAPHQAIRVPVRLSTSGEEGTLKKPVALIFHGYERTPLMLAMAGTIKKRFAISPEQIVLNSRSDAGEVVKRITLKRLAGSPPFDIMGAESPARWIKANVNTLSGDSGEGEAWEIPVRISPPVQAGRYDSAVFIQTSDPRIGTISVRVLLAVKTPEVE